MLQQTRVAAVIPRYRDFLAELPTVESLATAKLDRVLHLWSGLGYYARARNLHRAAGKIVSEHGGRFPNDLEGLCALPGIGSSTAGAILAAAFGRRGIILDGNVKRLLARYHGIAAWPGQADVLRRLWQLAEQYTPQREVAAYNQAMMDLGATVCTRHRPDCGGCPLNAGCATANGGDWRHCPAPRPARKLPQRQTMMLLLVDERGNVLLQRRAPTGLWGGLWSLPEITERGQLHTALKELGVEPGKIAAGSVIDHGFSHFRLRITPLIIAVKRQPKALHDDAASSLWYNPEQPAEVGLAAPILKLLASFSSTNKDASIS